MGAGRQILIIIITITIIKIKKLYICGLESIFTYIMLFDLKETSVSQDKEVIKNMGPRVRLHRFS